MTVPPPSAHPGECRDPDRMARSGGWEAPSMMRIVLGLILAPIIPCLLIGSWTARNGDAVNGWGFAAFLGIFYGIGPTVVLGVPTLWVVRRVLAPKIEYSILIGAAVASVLPILAALTISPVALL